MNCKMRKLTTWASAFVLVLGLAATASAQVFTGRIDATVEDSTGGRLPGVSVDLTGPLNQTQVTDAQGQAHFLNLPVGIYSLKANLSGFNPYTNASVQVAAAAATPIAVRLSVAGTAETVNVTAATPVIDTKRETTTTNVTLEELQNIPSARDPWVVMQTVPSIYVDRVNVGGSESGQQSNYIGKGSYGSDNTWNIDGIPVTDMGATGSTPTYYDFDMFQEMAVTTGGADASNPTPGVQLNMVLKKGSNTPHGNANVYFENENLQGNNLDPTLAQRIGGSTAACKDSGYTKHCGNRTDKYLDNGFDIGGPLVKDRLWAWGRIGRTDVKNITLTGSPDETFLNNYAFKSDAQLNTAIRAGFTFFEGNKVKNGRGVSAVHPPETGWNQTGPTKLFKGDGNFVIGQNLFASARVAYISGGFQLAPVGGLDTSVYLDDAGVWHGSYLLYKTTRPQYYGGGDASYFAGKHEVKFGFAWRKTPVDSLSQWPGTSRIVTYFDGYPNLQAQVTQDFVQSTTGRYVNGFVTDTISLNRLTVIAGIRIDKATSSLNPGTAPAVAGFSTILPAKTASAVDGAYSFTNVTPRVGITYAMDDARKTIARASYAMFASQLGAASATFISPAQYSYALYSAVDRNGNHVADPNEIGALIGTQGFDPANPGKLSTSNKIGDISAPRTQELLVGLDREVMPNFGVSATVTYRYQNNFLWNPPNGATSASYKQTGTFSGTFANVGTVAVPYYGVAASALPAGFGYNAQNRPDYHQRYLGFEASATKRMSNRWMARLGFSTQSWNEYFDAPDAIMDPTPTPTASGQFSNLTASGPLVNGGAVVISSSGSGKSGLYLVAPKYTFSANGLYQAAWGINLGGNLASRQGYGEPWFRSRVNTSDALASSKSLLLGPSADATRLPGVIELDVRAEKMFKIQRANIAFDFDVFNVLNRGTTLGIQYDARVGTYNQILEIQNPRIARVGLRFTF
jgi:hypothetical protein